MALQHIRLIASAVREGQEAARRGAEENPFDGRNELLRQAFHFGWSSEQELGMTFYTTEQLLNIESDGKLHLDDTLSTAMDLLGLACAQHRPIVVDEAHALSVTPGV
jgi:hypothetical protein